MKGTPLDDLEELLLRNRRKPIPIAARAIIRAGKGHRYWSSFDTQTAEKIEVESKKLHRLLFDPEINLPIKTLDLPLSGSKGVRTAMQILIDFLLVANRNQSKTPKKIDDYNDDADGQETISVLKKTIALASRITGNDRGSLGLHPAIYFYGPTGRHSSPMFLGTVSLISEKLEHNNKGFFIKFTLVREKLESLLIDHKDLIATILQKHISHKRVQIHHKILELIIEKISKDGLVTEEDLISFAELEGKLITGDFTPSSTNITDDSKSKVFIHAALRNAIKCPICKGYLDVEKSVSYDHIERVREGGSGSAENCQLTHPYCNQSVKQ